jgi:cob(I)alamin adenosyltransferase
MEERRIPRRKEEGVKIYTRTGDGGETSLFGGARVSKHDPRVAAYGDVDELNAVLGVARAQLPAEHPLAREIEEVQRDLFGVGGEIATPEAKARAKLRGLVTDEHVLRLEKSIDRMDETLPKLTRFILPGGGAAAASLHVARTVCRRAERSILALGAHAHRPEILRYMNRLADWIFVAARTANRIEGREETPW